MMVFIIFGREKHVSEEKAHASDEKVMEKMKEIVMSGIRPTGFLHLGNYFGAVQNYVKMQDEYECFFMIADLHSLTTHPDTSTLKTHTIRVLSENIACGLDPERCALYCQSHVPETAELYLFLNMLAYKGELEKTPTFKEKVRLQPDNVNAGLLTYPVLQAADILLHRATQVPVGKDQEQHLEIARNYVNRFSRRYGNVFPEPYAFNFGRELVKVPSLDGSGKMSKSENQLATLYLADDDDTIRTKIRKAKTDSTGGLSQKKNDGQREDGGKGEREEGGKGEGEESGDGTGENAGICGQPVPVAATGKQRGAGAEIYSRLRCRYDPVWGYEKGIGRGYGPLHRPDPRKGGGDPVGRALSPGRDGTGRRQGKGQRPGYPGPRETGNGPQLFLRICGEDRPFPVI